MERIRISTLVFNRLPLPHDLRKKLQFHVITNEITDRMNFALCAWRAPPYATGCRGECRQWGVLDTEQPSIFRVICHHQATSATSFTNERIVRHTECEHLW